MLHEALVYIVLDLVSRIDLSCRWCADVDTMYIFPALVALPLLALRASAFLIPSSIGTLDNGNGKVKVTVVPEEENELRKSILASLPHVVALRCPECSFEGREGVENKIVSTHSPHPHHVRSSEVLCLLFAQLADSSVAAPPIRSIPHSRPRYQRCPRPPFSL